MESLGPLLIVEDNAPLRATLAAYLAKVGFQVETAGNVAEAVQKLAVAYPLVLSDIRMPGASGIDFLRELHRLRPEVGIFLMTGYPTVETIIEAKQCGAVAYFRKPISLPVVAARLREYLNEMASPASAGQTTGPAEISANRTDN